MANVMDMLRIFTNLSNKRDGVECKILISLSKWDFLAGGWKSKTSAGIKDIDMGVIVIDGPWRCGHNPQDHLVHPESGPLRSALLWGVKGPISP